MLEDIFEFGSALLGAALVGFMAWAATILF